jgi:hypothetical protein
MIQGCCVPGIRKAVGSLARPGLTALTGMLVLAGVLVLGGCAHSAALRGQGDLSELQRALPGIYTGGPAAGAAAGAAPTGDAASSAVTLTITPLTLQQIGDIVYFVRETPADNSRLVLAQGIWTLAIQGATHERDHGRSTHREPARSADDDHARIVQHRFLFKDPRRWAGAADEPDVLFSMLPQDLQALPGCDLVWRRTSSGFETEGGSQTCHPGSNEQGLWIEQHAQLVGTQLSLTERRTDANGALATDEAPLSLQLTRSGAAP